MPAYHCRSSAERQGKLASMSDTNTDRRGVLLALAGVGVLLGALYLAGYFLLGERVPSGVEVARVDIGGLTPQAAEDRLRRELAPRADDPLRVTYEAQTYQIDPAQAGLSFDVEATVAEAGGGRTWDPRQMVQVLVGDDDVDPVIEVDDDALQAAIEQVAAQVASDPVEPAVTFTAKGEQEVVHPRDGVTIDLDGTREALLAAYLREETPVALLSRRVRPQVDEAQLQSALDAFATPAVAAPVTLDLPEGAAKLPVSTYAPALSLTVADGELTPRLDTGVLGQRLRELIVRLGSSPRDATVVLRKGQPVVVPDRPGVRLDAGKVADALLPVLAETGPDRRVKVGVTTAQADFTTEDARALKIREPVSSFVTYYPDADYRNINQGRAAELINGTVLMPGDTFSFNDTVGERTRANGFVVGFVISNGAFAEDLGGGVSQVVTTTFNAAFFAGLKDVAHTPHSFYIDRYPVGREATVAWPDIDLRFKNTTPYGVLIEAWVVPSTPSSSGEMHVRMWSTKYWDVRAGVSERTNATSPGVRYDSSAGCVSQVGVSGFDIDVYRFFRRAGSDQLVRRETMHTTYLPADTVNCT